MISGDEHRTTMHFDELHAARWLTHTLLDLDGIHKRVGEGAGEFETRRTSRWLAAARLSEDQRATFDELATHAAERIEPDVHHSIGAAIPECPWADATAKHRLYAFYKNCRGGEWRWYAAQGRPVYKHSRAQASKRLGTARYTSQPSPDSTAQHAASVATAQHGVGTRRCCWASSQ